MSKQMDTIDLDNFCQQLFRTLDHLGGSGKTRLLPMRLTEAPTAFEKYPRMLVGLIQRYGVEAGFKEWESKVLRDASPNRTESEFSELLSLYKWMQDNKTLFDKTNLNHLKRSFYGRIYTYLYPRRLLVVAYTTAHIGDGAAFDDQAIIREFRATVDDRIKKFSEVYPPDMIEQIIKDAQTHLLVEKHYYRAWKL